MTAARTRSSPYIGPRPYGEADQDLFFGRDRERHDVRSLWLTAPFLTLYGASGVGKTSLIRAGVLPLLTPGEAEVLPSARVAHSIGGETVSTRRPGNMHTQAVLAAWKRGTPDTKTVHESVTDFLCRRPRRKDEYGEQLPLLVILDQFEELFTAYPYRWEEREPFLEDLATAVERVEDLHILIAMREDFLAGLLQYDAYLGSPRNAHFRLQPLRPPEALKAVVGPARTAGRSYRPGTAEKIVDDLSAIQVLDVDGSTETVKGEFVDAVQLQVVCQHLWSQLPLDIATIDDSHLERYGDADTSLREFYEEAIREVSEVHSEEKGHLRWWIENTFITEMGTRGTAYEGRGATREMANDVARAFENRHILKVEQRAGSRWYELSHDRLIAPIQKSNRTWRERHGMVPAKERLSADTERRHSDAYFSAAEQSYAQGDLETAQQLVQRAEVGYAKVDDPRSLAATYSFLGDLASESNDFEVAESHYRQAIALYEISGDHQTAAWIKGSLGWSLWYLGRLIEAEELFRKVVNEVPNHEGARNGLVQLLADTGRGESALGMAEEAVRSAGDETMRAYSRSAFALALAQSGRLEEAEAELNEALSVTPDNAWAHLRGAKISLIRGNHREAKKRLRKAVRAKDPELSAYYREEAERLLHESA
ncbi:tetratricopeptide repeat protein [Streptomyces sioyaensis]|uniref:nSTAND1 domain-containing NTPase n=1 Tax=Streptomyces sioyaensis TaxID=67364 RepID=UPI0036A8E22E